MTLQLMLQNRNQHIHQSDRTAVTITASIKQRKSCRKQTNKTKKEKKSKQNKNKKIYMMSLKTKKRNWKHEKDAAQTM